MKHHHIGNPPMKYLKQYNKSTGETFVGLVPDEIMALEPGATAEEISQADFQKTKKIKVGLRMLGPKACCVLYKVA